MNKGLLAFIFLIPFICGCSSTRYTYRQIENDKDQFTNHTFQCSLPALHKAVTRVLLTKKFVIDHEDAVNGTLTASRYLLMAIKPSLLLCSPRSFLIVIMRSSFGLTAFKQQNVITWRTALVFCFSLFLCPEEGVGSHPIQRIGICYKR